MNVICMRTGNGYVVLNAQHDIVGILKSFEGNRKVRNTTGLKMPITDVERAIQDYAVRKRGS